MRLRYLFIVTFSLVALIPLILFWMWPYSKALESEYNDVKERHLLIAKNLAGAFERYYKDVTGVLVILNDDIDKESESIKTIFKSYGYQSVLEVSKKGDVLNCLSIRETICQTKVSPHILELAIASIKKDQIVLSTVTEDKSMNTGPILLGLKEKGDNFIIAYLSTDYIVQMGKKVAFGKKGHAAVVDQEGNVLAHPLDSWIKSRKNISKVSAVQKMMSGQTGVEIFYSPALKDDMIAGYTSVSGSNWGVMVPQPVSELKNKAKSIDEMAMYVLLLGLGLALLITIPISFLLINPLERLSSVIRAIGKGRNETKIEFNTSKIMPLEIRELKNGFIKMMDKIDDNNKSITRLAYTDMNTGLPNRNYFYELINKSFDKMKKNNQKGALVFIDFDGFKEVNDTHGHRAGDELLSMFAQRLMKHFSFSNESKTTSIYDIECLHDAVPARLAGDEFVILFRNISDKDEIKRKVEELFEDVFTEYTLYGDVKIKLSGSAGIALFPKDGDKYNKILKSADMAMYSAKAAGKNTIKFYKA